MSWQQVCRDKALADLPYKIEPRIQGSRTELKEPQCAAAEQPQP